jgi:hypothetical protein
MEVGVSNFNFFVLAAVVGSDRGTFGTVAFENIYAMWSGSRIGSSST